MRQRSTELQRKTKDGVTGVEKKTYRGMQGKCTALYWTAPHLASLSNGEEGLKAVNALV